MRSALMAVALLVSLGLVAVAPAPAGAAGQKVKFEALKVKRGGIGRGQSKRAPKVGGVARVKNFFARRVARFRPINRTQHAFAPMKSGDTRVFDIITNDGKKTTTSMMTQNVSEVRLQDGVLRAQVAQTWESDGHASTTHHVQDVSREGVLMVTAEKLDKAPITPIRVEGVGLPKKLSPGKTWNNRTSWEVPGGTVEAHTEARVIGKVRRAGPDRRMHEGVEIEAVTHSTTTLDGTPHRSTIVQRSIYLKGIGEVESTSHTPGEAGSVTRRLVGFTPGGDPG
jgi:hypothetical protein